MARRHNIPDSLVPPGHPTRRFQPQPLNSPRNPLCLRLDLRKKEDYHRSPGERGVALKRILLWWFLISFPAVVWGAEESLRFGQFGTVTIYRQSPHPSHVVLFVSGDGGWNSGVVDMARELSSLDALVVGIDIRVYLKNLASAGAKCSYSAADFEALSQFVQKKLAAPKYEVPVLVGYSSGATLVYAVLVQAPTGTFRGAISMGFCPDLNLSKPLCAGSGLRWNAGPKGKGFVFLPASLLTTPWIAFQGAIDQVCSPAETERYVGQVGHGRLVQLPKVGHGFSVPRNWLPQFKEAFSSLVNSEKAAPIPRDPTVQDLPLEIVPAKGLETDLLAVLVSGDGGWAGLDRDVAGALSDHGIPVVGLNSLQYFWKRRTPDGAAADLERILRHYLVAWDKKEVILVGYSRGADVLPFMTNRLPLDLRDKTRLLAMLGPSHEVGFEFHLAEWLGDFSGGDSLPVLPEVEKLRGMRILCLEGNKEEDSLCPSLPQGLAKVSTVGGGHHFGGDYEALAEIILKEVK